MPTPNSELQSIGDNVNAKVANGHLTLDIDLNAKAEPSKSGKSLVIASTRGNTNAYGVQIGLNIYKPNR